VDSELMAMGAMLFEELGIAVSLELNSLGCPECRPGYRAELLSYINERHDSLCSDCRRRSSTNPLRVLDCKVPSCREQIVDAPSLLDHLCGQCRDHFGQVQDGLQQLGVAYRLNKFMVRGLDYYCRTTFEFITSELGAQGAVAAGGRYDGLIESLGGPKNSPGIGFAMGMERLVLLLQQQEKSSVEDDKVDLFVAGIGEQGSRAGFGLAHQLRAKKFSVAMDYEGRSLKSQMKQADKAGARFVLIIGDAELSSGKGVLRNMMTKEEQQDISLSAAAIAECIPGK
jgi:histidyl-tRNA synthetase